MPSTPSLRDFCKINDTLLGRRTFITRLADSGVAVHVLAALAGHRHIATTQRYITVNDAMLARAVELL